MIYLDNASTTFPKPRDVVDAVAATFTVGASPGRGGSAMATAAAASVATARHDVARFLGAPNPERLAFTLNATDALNLAIKGLVTPGARVVTTTVEHAAVMRPLRRLERDAGVTLVRVLPDATGRVTASAIRSAVGAGAACVVATCASNVTGAIQPWAEIAEALAPTGIPLVLDASQAAGSLALDIAALGPHAAVAFTGHKALMGPMGVGGIVVGEGVTIRPWREGGTGDSEGLLQPDELPRRLEAGTPPLPAIAGLAAGVRWLEAQGVATIRHREAELVAALLEGLLAIPGVTVPGASSRDDARRPRAPLVGFLVDGYAPDEVALLLDGEFGITVRAGLHCAPAAHETLRTLPAGTVRASIGPTTPPDSVDALLRAVRRIAAA